VGLVIICPVCGAENPDSAEFCGLCFAVMGFDSAEDVVPVPKDDDGVMNKYPSSFSPDAPGPEEDPFAEYAPEVPPVEIGHYGARSGEDVEETVLPEAGRTDLGPPKKRQKPHG
jgi:zinc-ribbon domain